MQRNNSLTDQLNPLNLLTAHKVSPGVSPGLVEASLQLTTRLFPEEPGAANRLRRAYEARILGHNRMDDFEVLDYFIFTLGQAAEQKVTGAGGLYRLVESSPTTDSIVAKLGDNPPPSVSFLLKQDREIREFIWGGRFYVEPSSASSPRIMPFILLHICHCAQALINSLLLAPVLLVFTRLHDNQNVQNFYRNLGFESLGISLRYAEEIQEVLCLDLSSQAPIIARLEALAEKANR